MSYQQPLAVDARAIPVRNAWYLLLYAWDLVQWKGRWDSDAEASPNLMGLLARVLVDSTADLLRRQLTRSHQCSIREIGGIRGRIDFARSLKARSFDSGRAVCVFPELTVNTPRNRIIRSTIEHLLKDQRVDVGARQEKLKVLKHDMRTVLGDMEGVTPIAIQGSDFTRLQLGRSDASYKLPLALCRLIHRCEMPTEQRGDHVMGALLREEVTFSDLFERFVRNFLRHALTGASIGSETLTWPDEIGSPFVPRMRTDITVDWDVPAHRRLIIDTKYYANALAARYESAEKFHASHLYQLYTYLRTQEDRGGGHAKAAGMLLYPTTSASLDERMRVQGHDIEIRTLSLAEPWETIEGSLLAMVARHGAVH